MAKLDRERRSGGQDKPPYTSEREGNNVPPLNHSLLYAFKSRDDNEMQKINSIVYFTDKPTLVQTIRDVLDIPIHHVVEVDFNGFMRLFETIGGLDVYLEYPLRDKKAQLDIPESGCVTLTPLQALGLVRSRELQAYVENFDGWYGPSANAWV